MMRAAGAHSALLPLLLVMVTVTWCSRLVPRRSEVVPLCDRVCEGPLVPCERGTADHQDHIHYRPRRPLPVSRSSCGRVRGLTSRQRRFCRRHPDLLQALLSGYQLGASDCRHRFRLHRWNCAALGRHLDFGHVQVRGTREAAVMYALQSAAVTHSLYAACRRGTVEGCACRRPGPDTRAVDFWKWSGCGEGLSHSGRQARRFLNARETEGDARSLMNRHNNRAGVKAVTGGRRRRCHCHGPSGSCSLRTCWMDAPSSFSVIGDRLQQQLDSSQLVHLVQLPTGKRRLRAVEGDLTERLERRRLVHLEPSPTYCDPDPERGHNGTVGRVCRKNRSLPGSCEYMCCGRGYNIQITYRRYCCNFHQRPGRPTECRQRTRLRKCQ
ncbi:protein Wnt-2-like [Amphibalanus amphitrite]|uniref:protein Wnt-2-like n=1 Tax=Amphibalanus amphitrite TaxID=1232801 RepID=UPI001C919D87|nr:protein Wnt-2-like [Amphibalanus amphitrite]